MQAIEGGLVAQKGIKSDTRRRERLRKYTWIYPEEKKHASGGLSTPSGERPLAVGPTNLQTPLSTLAGRDWLGKSAGFPETFLNDCRTCFRQIFRIYAHLYHSHSVDPFWHLSGPLAKLGEFQHHPDITGSGSSITRRVTTPTSAKPQVKQEDSTRRRCRRASPSIASEDEDEIQLPSTVPKADAPLVRRLMTAMMDGSAAEDNEGMKKTWESLPK